MTTMISLLPAAHGSVPNSRTIGRWDNSSSNHSYWGGAYLKVGFTGTTVKVQLAASTYFYARIDGGAFTYFDTSAGTLVNLTPSPLASGSHTLTLVSSQASAVAAYAQLQVTGLVLDAGATTTAPPVASKTIEFIGDSITYGMSLPRTTLDTAGWIVGEQLGAEHTHVAWTGIPLVVNPNSSIGMQNAWFNLKTPDITPVTAWNFATYTADVVVINLGTNDNIQGVSTSTFQSAYVTFINGIRLKFPNAQILAIEPYNGSFAAQINAAVTQVTNAGDPKVHYVDTTGWLNQSSPYVDTIDGLHPSVSGNQKIAAKLVPIIAPYLGSSAPSTPTGLAAAAGNGQVALSWNTSSGASTYNVYRGTAAGAESATPIATGLTGTSYTNAGLTNGTTYYYKVAAVNSVGTSAQSTEASGKPAGIVVTLDPLSDFSYTTSRSSGWYIDTSAAVDYFDGDAGRASRTSNDTENLVYSFNNISTFTAKVYIYVGPIGAATFQVSTDGGNNWTNVAVNPGSKSTTSGWGYYNVTPSGALPAGVNRLKVIFTYSGYNAVWDPQLSQISITHQ